MPRLANALGIGELHLKLDSANPTHSFKDRVVAIAAAKAQEFGLGTLSATSTGNLANAVAARAAALGMPAVIFCPAGLEPEKLAATTIYGATIYGVRGSYDDCSRLVSELAGDVDWAIVNVNLRSYYAEGSKTLAFEICEQLGWETPDAVVVPIGSGAMFTKVWQGFQQFERLGLSTGDRPRLVGAQAAGCAPVATAFAEERRVMPVRPNSLASSIAIGNPADGDLAIATAAASGGGVYAVPEEEIGPNISLLAETGRHLRRGRDGCRARRAARGGTPRGRGRERPRRPARHRHRPEDAAARERERRRGRDRARRRRAARAAGGGCMNLDPVLASYRDEITALDVQLVETINKRLETVLELRRHKEETGLAFLDPDREAWLVAHLKEINDGPLSADGVDELITFVLDLVKREVER